MDVRWASDRTIHVAWLRQGVSEIALDGKFTDLRRLFPDANAATYEYYPFELLATSSQFVVAAAIWNQLAFRRAPQLDERGFSIHKVPVGLVQDIDLSDGRLLLLGTPISIASSAISAGVTWLGPVTPNPEHDLQPILTDIAGLHTPTLINCSRFFIGAARFLPDGTFIVVPGFQPGAHMFDSSGRLLRTWDTRALGLDADAGCSAITNDQLSDFGMSAKVRGAYYNQHRIIDAVLPFAQGPGLIIRSVAAGQVHWQVVVLRPTETLVYDIPFTGKLPYERLRGDVRGNRIVLLRANRDFDTFAKGQPHTYKPTHLYVAELPQVLSAPARTDQSGGQR